MKVIIRDKDSEMAFMIKSLYYPYRCHLCGRLQYKLKLLWRRKLSKYKRERDWTICDECCIYFAEKNNKRKITIWRKG